MMWYWGTGVHWWGWMLGFLAMIAFWALVIWLIWYFVTRLTHHPDSPRHPDEARRILDERLARGEIDGDEYQRLRDLISGSRLASQAGEVEPR